MKFQLQEIRQPTLIPPELLEIYQPVLGFEAVSVWINIYHALLTGQDIGEADLLHQMNITQRSLRASIKELKKYRLLEETNSQLLVVLCPLPVMELVSYIKSSDFSTELQRRVTTLAESFLLRRGQSLSPETASPQREETAQLSEQLADEFATRFIKECNFVPSRQLRERFDLWFEQIQDPRLLEELLERTKRKVEIEGNKGTCPSAYADKIVRQWLVQGIKTYPDLLRRDQEFHARWEYYRIVEKELGRSFNSLTPAEKEIVDRWIAAVNDVKEMSAIIKRAILSGEYQGKGAPGIAFIDRWFSKGEEREKASTRKKGGFTHQHSITDLQKVIQRKTMVGLEDESNEG